MRFLIALLLSALAATAAAQTLHIETFQVRSMPAASMVDSIRPLLGEQASVSAFHDKLIVKANPAELQQVRALLGELDRPPRRLIIEVRQAGSVALSTQGIGYGLNSDNVRIGSAAPGNRAEIRYGTAETQGRVDGMQRIQALDGRPAFIRAGEDVPVYQGYQGAYGGRFIQGFQMQYRNTGNGFYALPRMHGDRVTVEIHQQQAQATGSNRFLTQQASTVLQGRAGEWLTLGSTGGSNSNSGDAPGQHFQTRRTRDGLIEMRVLPVD
jgi:hypothetical protein